MLERLLSGTVTVRYRDSMQQERVSVSELLDLARSMRA